MKELSTGKPQAMHSNEVMPMVNEIFRVLKVYYTAYGMVMKTPEQELDFRKQWAYELICGKVSKDMVVDGMTRAKSHATEDRFCKWPSIGDFIVWCHGLPDASEAYAETIHKMHSLEEWEPSHPAVALVFEVINLHDFKKMDAKQAKAEYSRAYGKVSARLLKGENLTYTKPEPVKRIESVRTPEKIEFGIKSLSDLKDMLGGGIRKSNDPLVIEDIEGKKAAVAAMAKKFLEKQGGNNDAK